MSATLAERRQGLDAATLAAFAPVAASTVGHLSERGYLRGVRPCSMTFASWAMW